MNIKELNIKWLIEFAGSTDDLVICRLSGSKLFRIPFVPEKFQYNELFEVLLTFKCAYKKGIYFFKFDTEEDLNIFKETLAYMDVEFLAIHEPYPAAEENLN